MKNYSYPRVITSVTALPRSNARPAAEDTTVLFVPIISETGPAGELLKIHSLEEYRSKFGLDERLGLTLLNISNWLTSGGTLYAYRFINPSSSATVTEAVGQSSNVASQGADPKYAFEAKSKYIGSLLNNFKVRAAFQDGGVLLVQVKNKDGITVENIRLRISAVKSEEWFDVSNLSEYLSKVKVIYSEDVVNGHIFAGSTEENPIKLSEVTLIGGSDGWTDYNAALRYFWTQGDENVDIKNAIGNRLETPIDLIMDAGYPYDIKKLMIKAISHKDNLDEIDALRPDINGVFDLYTIGADNKPTNIISISSSGSSPRQEVVDTKDVIKEVLFDESDVYERSANVFFYTQYFVISEEAYFDKDMVVFPSYFLSRLIPANDLAYGIQYPTAGTRRAELEGVKKISLNPDPDQKDLWFLDRINYVEKDSRGYYFMSERTFDGSSDEKYTALSFINNARVTVRMVHDLERLGRDYLFEFNDAATLANMSAVLNRYVTNWIANRTLSDGKVEVSKDPYSDEKVNAVLYIRFVNTIETIAIDLILE